MIDKELPIAANFILYTAASGDINLNMVLREKPVISHQSRGAA